VLAALHDLNLAARYFPRLLLFRGKIEADGPPAQVLDAALLSRVYETPVRVGILRGEQHLSVLPPGQSSTVVWQPKREATPDGAPPVHVLAGGGSGELMMRALADAGIAFSAGPLNVGDSDYSLAQQLSTVVLAEPPYAPVSAEGMAAVEARLAVASATILCPMPLGPGNVALLDATLAACEAGRTVLLFDPAITSPNDTDALLASVGTRDFSDRGAEVYRRLLAAGCRCAASPAHALALLPDLDRGRRG
jgi:cobalamin transport system ATP-binding protein